MSNFTSVQLADGTRMPSVGLGLWKIENETTSDIVYQALKLGYRHLDAACDYGNEKEAGNGIRRALDEGICSREELWVTSKLWNTYHREAHVRPAIERSLRDLGLDYLDLYLVHFPIATKYVEFDERYPPGWVFDPNAESPRMEPDCVPLAETWKAMEGLKESGLAKQIGVSNFNTALMRDLFCYASIRPAVLQIESHPYLVQAKLHRFCRQENIAVTAFSPLGAGSYVPLGMATEADSVLKEPVVAGIAEAHQKSIAQIVLRWGIQRGNSIVPKSSKVERLKENLNLFDFELTNEQMTAIDSLDRHRRFNDPGDFCEAAFGEFFPIYD